MEREPIQIKRPPARTLPPVFDIASVEAVELKVPKYGKGITALDLDSRGRVYMLSFDFSAPRGARDSIQVFAPNGDLLRTVPLSPDIWEPPVDVIDLGVARNGTLYATVEWPVARGGIIALDDQGGLLSKSTFSDFLPRDVAVDSQDRVWVLGREVDPEKVLLSKVMRINPKNPYGEQIRVYTHDLKFLTMPIRDQKAGHSPSSLAVAGDEVVYYASGTDTTTLFRQGRLLQRATVPELAPMTTGTGQGGSDGESTVLGVYKVGPTFLLVGSRRYATPAADESASSRKRFFALMSIDGAAASPEFEPPLGVSPLAYSEGYLVCLSKDGSGSGIQLVKIKPKL
jgi:hypothetical protein